MRRVVSSCVELAGLGSNGVATLSKWFAKLCEPKLDSNVTRRRDPLIGGWQKASAEQSFSLCLVFLSSLLATLT